MTPARFSDCLAALGWSVRALADRLGEHRTTVRRWVAADEIPDAVGDWLENVTALVQSTPPPNWRDGC